MATLTRRSYRCGTKSRRGSELWWDAQSAVQQPRSRGRTCIEPEQTISGVAFRWDAQLFGLAALRPKEDFYGDVWRM